MDLVGYRKIYLPELQKILLVRLKEVIDFLDKNKIDYFATYGTALGAYRHKGFIPWDDDIDLGMTRENYERFLKIAKQLANDHFVILGYHFSNHIEHGLTKIGIKGTYCPVRGLKKNYDTHYHIDIFPFDSFPKDPKEAKKIARQTSRIRSILYFKTKQKSSTKFKSFVLSLFQILLIPFSTKRLARKLDLYAQKFNKLEPNSKYVVDAMGVRDYEKQKVSRDCVEKTVLMDFSNIQFKAPSSCNRFLEEIYGPNFMTPSDIRLDKDKYFAFAREDLVV